MNISSLVVDARPEHADRLRSALGAWPGVDVHAVSPEGRLIVTIEAATDAATTDTFAQIQQLDGVMAVAMVYHQCEPDQENCDDLQRLPV